MKRPAPAFPRKGDRVVTCGHNDGPQHWLRVEPSTGDFCLWMRLCFPCAALPAPFNSKLSDKSENDFRLADDVTVEFPSLVSPPASWDQHESWKVQR